jgi:hypothetical protein
MGASNPVGIAYSLPPSAAVHKLTNNPHQLDRLVGLAMLIIASTVFAYYTVWTLLMVCTCTILPSLTGTKVFPRRETPIEE